MALPREAMLAAGTGVIGCVLNLLLYRSWPITDAGELVGPVVVGIAIGLGMYIGLRIVARRNRLE
ncbi:MAG: hypothetical protein IRZ13_09275 [Acetobacteraceae bacterium]|nr:hypothetical protein [Acetobacteraceae bacterium]